MKNLKHYAIGFVMIALAACATTSPMQQLAYTVAIQQATSKFIEHKAPAERAERASEVIRVAELLKAVAAGEDATIGDLETKAFALIAEAHLELSDEALANTLVAAVAQGLRERIADGVLKPDDRVRVEYVLDNIIATSTVYVSN